MQYQTFPGSKGGSLSLQKLSALRLPSLKGKRFLDIGCNEGFFCGYAMFDGAEEVVGIDQSKVAIQKAKLRFTDIDFRNQSWDELPEGTFDVIIMLSALHYATDQEAMIHKMMSKLKDDGLLVLEISMARGVADDWVKVKRAIDERYFPTRNKLASVLNNYAWKIIGHSVNQEGDPLQRYVVHIKPMKPYAFLFIQEPGSGKSTVSRKLLAGGNIPLLGGDSLYQQIANGKLQAPLALQELVSDNFSTATIDKTTHQVFKSGLVEELVDFWLTQINRTEDFAVDSYIPIEYHEVLKDVLISKGFFPVELSWSQESKLENSNTVLQKTKQYEQFLKRSQEHHKSQNIVKIKKLLSKDMQSKIKWHLDSPSNGEWFVVDVSINISGWLVGLGEYASDLSIYVDYMGGGQVILPSKIRLDVVDAFKETLNYNENLYWTKNNSGFSISIDFKLMFKGIELGVIFDGNKIPLAHISVQKPDGKVKTVFKSIAGFKQKL